ncbi:Hypothetical predicted protein [Paramuricea clavata]|uniref:Uncharacterized protein n=1 Tax=Paramuricea clavata TaxID=317549 RepID=A0A7D9HC97_PARCT|nr:Hypothetical predicted protein [Paramuricea clavata]
MGKVAEIQLVGYIYGGPKGIIIFTTVSDCVEVIGCWLECPTNRIHLGRPTDFEIGWDVRPWILMEEEREEEEERRAEEEKEEEREMEEEEKCAEAKMEWLMELDEEERRAEAEMEIREAMYGQIGYKRDSRSGITKDFWCKHMKHDLKYFS